MSKKKITPLNQFQTPSLPDRSNLGSIYATPKRGQGESPSNYPKPQTSQQSPSQQQKISALRLLYFGLILTLPIAIFVSLFAWTFGISRFDFYYVPLTGLIVLILTGIVVASYRKIATTIDRTDASILFVSGMYLVCLSPVIRALSDIFQFGSGSLALAGSLFVAVLASGATLFAVITYCVLHDTWKTKTKISVLAFLALICFSSLLALV